MTQEQHTLVIVLVKGHPGVGKSTLARCLCQQLKWPLIDKDDTRDCLQTLPATALQSFDANKLSYDVMFRHAATQLSLGLSTVLDCPFARVELYDQAANIAQQHGARIIVVDCTASIEAQWRQQVEQRARQQTSIDTTHKPQGWQDIQHLLQRYKECWQWSFNGSRKLQHHIVVDTTTDGLHDNLQRVTAFILSVVKTNFRQIEQSPWTVPAP